MRHHRKPSAIITFKTADGRNTLHNRPIHSSFKLDKDGNFDLADFVGPKIPAGMPRYAKPYTEEHIWHMGIVLLARGRALTWISTNAKVELNKGRITLTGPNGMQRVIPVDSDGSFYINWCLTANDDQRDRLTHEPIEALTCTLIRKARLTGELTRIDST